MNSFKRRLLAIAVILPGLIPLAYAEAAEPPFTGVVTGDNVNVRAGAGDNYYVVTQLDRGDILEIHEELFGWYQVDPPEDAYSYISMAFVNARGDGTRGVVNANRVRVRAPSPAGPSKSYRTQVTLSDGDEVRILGQEDGYYKIAPPEGAHLFVSAQYVQKATADQIARARQAAQPDRGDDARQQPRSTETRPDDSSEADPEEDADEADDDVADDDESDVEQTPAPRPLVAEIAVLADGSVQYDGETLDEDALADKLAEIADAFDTLTVQVSPRAPFLAVSGVMDQARSAGLSDIEVAETAMLADAGRQPPLTSAEVTPPDIADAATQQPPDREPVVLEQDVTDADDNADPADDDDATEDAVAQADDQQDQDQDEEEELDEPLTFEELERRYAQVSQMPLGQQPIGELRMDYEHLRVTGELSGPQRRLVDARIEVLSMRQELQASLVQLSAVQEESRQTAERRQAEDAARPKQYAAVGRLTTSTLYTGEKLPLLYRVVDPTSGRTVAYVQPGPGVDAVDLIGSYVGVEGRRDFEGALELYVITAENIDELTASDRPRQR